MVFLAPLGAIVWPLLRWLAPAIPAKGLLYLIAALAAVVAIGAPAGAVWLKMRGERSAAVSLERAACELSKAEDARVSAETLSHLLDRIAKAEDDDEGKTAKQLCAGSPFCRDRGKK